MTEKNLPKNFPVEKNFTQPYLQKMISMSNNVNFHDTDGKRVDGHFNEVDNAADVLTLLWLGGGNFAPPLVDFLNNSARKIFIAMKLLDLLQLLIVQLVKKSH